VTKALLFALICLFLPALAQSQAAAAQPDATVLKPGDNLLLENIPPIPMKIAVDTARYGDSRPAMLMDWHPTRRQIIIGTRFAETAQVHAVAIPGGARRQLTFFPDRVLSAQYLPDGNAFLFQKDVGGGEWYQIYRYDLATGATTLLTDGHSRNESYLLAHHDTKLVFTSTRRNNQDDDLWLVDAADSAGGAPSARLLLQVEGGGWHPLAWAHDNRHLLVQEEISINESHLWLVDAATGSKRLITSGPLAGKPGTTVSYSDATFSADDQDIYVLTDLDSEFKRLARINLASLQVKYLTTSVTWDVDEMAASEDGRSIAFATNENGYSRLYVLDTATDVFRALPNVPAGVVSTLRFHPAGRDLGFTVAAARSPADVYSVDVDSGKLDRWTQGETGGLDAGKFAEPVAIKWKSFDGLELSGFLYQPDAVKFPGKRPVIISIHGGPEAQFRPGYRGQDNYLIDELGVAIVAPNVRGSSGFGKSFLKLDNGFHREDTYRDIGALLDWLATQPRLDPTRVMIYGGSYGGHMTWAVSAFYNERIRCAMPIVGMSNLVTFLEHTEAYRRDLRRVEYGDERDPAMRAYLEKIAPMNHLASMRKPTFAVVGKNDPRVPWSESRQIIDKLNEQGTPTWLMVANDEGHGYAKKKNRDFLFDAEVLFIDRCLLDETAAVK